MKKIGLALGGGGLKGGYEIGSYLAFMKCKIKFDGIVGTSIGALNGAVIASGNYEKLVELWENINPKEIFDVDQNLIDYINGETNKISAITGLKNTIKNTIKEKGLSTDGIRNIINKYVDEEKIKKNKIDYGLATFKLKGLKQIYITKEEINQGDLTNYIIASCSLPIFKRKPMIDDEKYLDGAFHDNCPSKILIDKNYDLIYEIKIKGLGVNRRKKRKNTQIIQIAPSRNICKVIELNKSKIKENIKMGYFDTLRILKEYDGYKYTFKKTSEHFINLITRKIMPEEIKRIKMFFNVKTKKEAIIKSVEYLLERNNIDYYSIYNLYDQITLIKTFTNEKNFIYKFINKLSIL